MYAQLQWLNDASISVGSLASRRKHAGMTIADACTCAVAQVQVFADSVTFLKQSSTGFHVSLIQRVDTIINFLPPTQIARPLGKVGRFAFPDKIQLPFNFFS